MSYYGAPKHLNNASDSRRRAIQTRRERYPHWGRPNLKEYRGWQAQAYRYVKLAMKKHGRFDPSETDAQ